MSSSSVPTTTVAPSRTASMTSTSTSFAQPAESTTTRGGFSFSGGPTSFYRNLFYILVGLLGLFMLISAVSWWRNRKRRAMVIAEARRLGLLVPGMPGYAAERERLILAFRGVSSTTEKPEIWDALGAQRVPGQEMDGYTWGVERYEPSGGNCLWDEKLRPVAITPLSRTPDAPLPVSNLKTFPNAMAFRAPGPKQTPEEIMSAWQETARVQAEMGSYPPVKSAMMQRPRSGTRSGKPANLAMTGALAEVKTESKPEVQVAVLIRMPIPDSSNLGRTNRTTEEEEEAAVQEEWEGVEMGLCVAEVDISSADTRERSN